MFHLMKIRRGVMSEETVSESQFSLKTTALRAFDRPLSWYYSLSQVKKNNETNMKLNNKFTAPSIFCLQCLKFD